MSNQDELDPTLLDTLDSIKAGTLDNIVNWRRETLGLDMSYQKHLKRCLIKMN